MWPAAPRIGRKVKPDKLSVLHSVKHVQRGRVEDNGIHPLISVVEVVNEGQIGNRFDNPRIHAVRQKLEGFAENRIPLVGKRVGSERKSVV